MSKEIDERVVEMRFDNKQFESNVKTSMSTLDKLKEKLNLSGASKGLENIESAAKKVDLNPLGRAAETVTAKFSALQVMGVTALANITNSAVNAGKNLVKAFTIDPIKTGFQEYETQINAVQTILANTQSKGTTLDQVNAALDELNHYADMTIYNFTEMTRNIGTFTAAGVDLDTSVSAIKGIANLAAVSGSNSQQASTAMYQLSQALAAGTVKLQDWNSVVNAGMGGQVFQDALKETARVHGIAIDDMIKKEGSFRETLQNGWLSSEILTETLSKFTGDLTEEQLKSMGYTAEQAQEIMKLGQTANDAATKVKTFTQLMDTLKEAAQSGWTQTWEILVGDFEEAKTLWTSVSDTLSEMLNKSAEARNNMLQGWKDAGGRGMAVDALKNAFEGLMNIIKPIKEAFREIFPPTTSEQLVKMTERIRDLTAKFKEFTGKHASQIKSTFKGLFSIIKIGTTIIKSIVSGITQLIGKITGLSGGILSITGSLGNWISVIAESLIETNLFGKAINGIVGFLGKGIDKIKEFTGAIKNKFDGSVFNGFLNAIKTIWEVIQKIGVAIGTVFAGLGKALANAFRNGDAKSFLDILNGGLFATILLGIKKYIKGITDKFDDTVTFIDKIKDVLGSVEDSLKSWQQNLKAGTLVKIAAAIGILAASLLILSSIEPGKLTSSLGAITVLFAELIGSMALFEKITSTSKGMTKATTTLIGISISVLILASAMKKLSDLDWGQIARGLTGVLGLMIIVVGAAKILSTNSKKVQKGAVQMVIMAAALKILASVCEDLSKLNWEQLTKGVSGISGLLIAFAGFQALMKKIQPKKMLSSATSLILVGAAMEIFADVCNKFGKMDWPDLGKAGVAISGILVIAAGFGKLSSYSGKMISSSIALVIIGAAMEIFADVCNKFGQMKWQELGKAGAAIAGILALASGFVLLSGLANGMLKSVMALTIIAAAMEIFADVCNKFGQMDWEQLGKAGAAIGGILALAAGFSLLAGISNGMLKSAAALLVMSAALAIFTPILTTLGNMSWGEIIKGLISIAGAFTIFGVAGLVLGPLVPTILALSGAIALFGVGCLAAGAGVMAFAAGFTALAAAGAAGATAFVAALTVITIGILELIPQIIGVLTDAVVAICNVIIQSAPAIGEAIKALVLTTIDVLVECIPQLAEGLLKILLGVLDALAKYTPQIVTKLFEILKGIIESAVDALGSIDPETLLKGIVAMTGLMVALKLMASLAAGAMIGVLAFGAVIAELALVIAAIGALAQIPGLEWLISEGGDFLQKIGTAIGQFIGGIVGGIAEGATSVLPEVANNLSAFMTNITPFINGAKMIDESAMNGVKALAETILILTGAGILESITSWITGGASITTFADQLVPFGKSIKSFANEVAGIDGESVTSAANAGKVLSEMAKSLPKEDGWWQKIAGKKDLSSFSEKLTSFGKAIKSFSQEVTGINISAITGAASAIKEIINIAKSTSGVDFSGLSSFSSSMSKLGKSGFDNFIKAFSNSSGQAANIGKTLVTNIAKGVSSGLPTLTNSINPAIQSMLKSAQSKTSGFVNVGNTLISKFANAIKNGSNKMKSVMSLAIQAAINSSRNYYSQFSTLGLHLVNGFCKGISDNTFMAEAKAKAMAKAAYEAAKKELDVNSPSKKFMRVGRSVVEGFGKGITKNVGEVNKAAITMSKGVLEATQDVLGIHSPSVVFDEKVGRYIVQGIAEGIKKDMSAEEAAEKKAQNIVSAFQNELDRIERRVSNREKGFNLWKLTDGKAASDSAIIHKQMQQLNDDLYDYNEKAKLAKGEWETFSDMYGPNSKYTEEAYGKMLDAQIKAAETAAELLSAEEELSQSVYDRNVQNLEDQISRNEKENKLWELVYGEKASDRNRYLYYKNQYEEDAIKYHQVYQEELNRYNDFVKDYAEKNKISLFEAKKSEEAKKQWDKVLEAQINEYEARKKVNDNRKDYLEQEKEDLKDQYELTSDIADIKYQIWEKTDGRKATDVEKDTMKLAFLSEQLGAQAKLVKMAKAAWSEATGNDKQKKEKEYYQAQLELANLQSEVLDIQEENTKRQERALEKQRNAYTEYEDYIKKYEQYYLDHGMTKEELEKDARLVSGYDPNNAVKSMISKTTTALNNLQSNTQYNSLLSSFGEMGSSYASAVSEGIQNGTNTVIDTTSTLVKNCLEKIKSEKEEWTKVGITLVEKFIEGIKSKIQNSVDVATELASRTLEAIKNVCDGNMDYSPTIRPVLDMSDISSKSNSLNSIFGSTSLRLASSVSSGHATSKSVNSGSGQPSGATYSFVQNNYSPKALSSIEIYRQTNNIISKIGKKG